MAKLDFVEMELNIINARAVNPDFSTGDEHEVPESDIRRRLTFAALAFFVWVFSVAMIAIVPAIFLLPYLASLGIPLSDAGQIADLAKSDETAIFLQLAAILPAHLLTLLLAYIVITQGRKFEFFRSLGWDSGGIKWWHYCIMMGVFFVIAALVGYFVPEQENDLLRILRSSRTAVFVIAFIATFSAPLVEEVIYRGVLYSGFRRAFGVPAAFVLVTLLFSLVHVPQYYPSMSTIFLLTLLSVTLTGLRIWSNSLWPCFVLHTIFNGFQSVLLVAEPWLRTLVPEPSSAIIALNEIWTRHP